MHNLEEKILELKNVLMKVWSIESSSKWTPENPAKRTMWSHYVSGKRYIWWRNTENTDS
jgi:hypothetical protein